MVNTRKKQYDDGFESGYESDDEQTTSKSDRYAKLKQFYQKNNFPPKTRLYTMQRDAGLGYSRKEVYDWIKKQEVYQVTAPSKKQGVYDTIVAPKTGSNLMCDLIVYDRFKFGNYQYILNCIDIHSRYAYGVALTNRKTSTLINAFKTVFKKMGHVPYELQLDNEGAFVSEEFEKAMKNAGVKVLWFSEAGDIRKQAVVERHNRTLAEMLARWREASGSRDWTKVLDKMYEIYNDTYHSTIKAKPIDVWNGEDFNKQTVTKIIDSFKIGDKVRIKMHKKVFTKGDAIKFSRELYTIAEKKGRKYVLKNDDGDELKRRYTSDELRLANEVEEAEIEDKVENKNKELKKQTDERRVERNVTKEKGKLKNVGAKSEFDKGVEEAGRRTRTRKLPARLRD